MPTRSRSPAPPPRRSSRFAETDRAVLVGTQMVAKGHHFEGVALAAVVDADTGLGLPDFRAEERTFQLLTQLAGRSGRDAPGRVLVQTFQPDARAIRYAARHDVTGFLAEEIERRRELGYPPFRHLVRIVASGPDADGPTRLLTELKAGLGEDLLGPGPAAAPPWPASRTARGEDRAAAPDRRPGGCAARGRRGRDAQGRRDRRRRRRSAKLLIVHRPANSARSAGCKAASGGVLSRVRSLRLRTLPASLPAGGFRSAEHHRVHRTEH